MRNVALDGLRGLSCLQIVLFHYYFTVSLPLPWHGVLRRAVGSIDGVGVFFALSGFLIGGILLDHRSSANQLAVFYVRRICRILPVYWLLLLSFLLVRAADNHWRFGLIAFLDADVPFWHYLIFTQNNTTGMGVMWLAVTWSLAVEEQFYLMFPFLVRFLSERLLWIGVFASFVVCPLLRWQDSETHRLLLGSADQLMAGVLVTLAVRDDRWRTALQKYRRWVGAGLVIFLVSTVTLAAWFEVNPARYNLSVPFFAALIYYLATEPAQSRLSRALKLVAPVGLGSYFIYLFHLPVAYVVSRWIYYPGTGTVSLVVVAILAWLSYRFIEQPLITLGRKFKYR